MKAWRVGSLSMGITLLLLGAAVAISVWSGTEALNTILWVAPLVFILLGGELLLYLWLAGNERIIIRYDWMSVFFVAIIGTGSIAMAAFSSTGLLGQFRESLQVEDRTAIVQTEPVNVPENVSKIVVQSFKPVKLDEGDGRDVVLLGQLQYRAVDPLEHPDRMISTNTVGSTMYVMVSRPDYKNGSIVSESVHPQLTLILPKDIEVEQREF